MQKGFKMTIIFILLSVIISFSNCKKTIDDNILPIAALALAGISTGTGTGTSTGTGTGSSTNTSSAYSIGGSISGLTTSGLVLQNNSADDLTLSSGATSFTFSTKMSGAYSVSVKTQPTGQTCTVSNGSGTATANVTNVSVSCNITCSDSAITYEWGTFTDCTGKGVVKFVGKSGSFGGNSYSTQTLYFAKCSHGQTYDSTNNNCQGSLKSVKYCDATNNSCNGGTDTGTLDGNGNSDAYAACNKLNTDNYAGYNTGWRVTTKNELKLLINCTDKSMPNDDGFCGSGNYTTPSINNLFSTSYEYRYWSASSYRSYDAWGVDFSSGGVKFQFSTAGKAYRYFVFCVRSGP